MKKTAEHRRYLRHPTSIPITVTMADEKTMNLQALNNISTGGLSFESETAWKKGTAVGINFHPPFNFSKEILKVYGRVVWCKKVEDHFEVGIEFMKPTGSVVDVVQQIEDMYQQV
jgi:hypothetical protein